MTVAKDLVRKMLTPDPAKRITASQVLQHPWMVEHVNNKLSISSRLHAYCARRKLRVAQFVAYMTSVFMNRKK